MTTPQQLVPVPHPIRSYLDAHASGDAQTAIRSFSPDAVVTDQGETFHGSEAILRFLRDAGSEYTYTSEEVGTARVDDEHWIVAIRLEGDFPGGVGDERYRFTLDHDRITELSIGA